MKLVSSFSIEKRLVKLNSRFIKKIAEPVKRILMQFLCNFCILTEILRLILLRNVILQRYNYDISIKTFCFDCLKQR